MDSQMTGGQQSELRQWPVQMHGESLGWYQGGLFNHENSYVVVVVIEGQNTIIAERIGRNILDHMRSEGIP